MMDDVFRQPLLYLCFWLPSIPSFGEDRTYIELSKSISYSLLSSWIARVGLSKIWKNWKLNKIPAKKNERDLWEGKDFYREWESCFCCCLLIF